MTQVEPLSAVVEAEAPEAPPQEAPVQQATDVKDEEPMEQEKPNPVMQEESEPVLQVSVLYFILIMHNPAPFLYLNTYFTKYKLRV